MNRFELYELAVQSPDMIARFLRAVHGGEVQTLGEDFCGTAAVSRAWVELDEKHRAIAVDRDPEPLEFARAQIGKLDAARRGAIGLKQSDVRAVTDPVNVIAVLNFSICEHHERSALVEYLHHAHERITQSGVFVCDVYVGPDGFIPGVSSESIETRAGSVIYTWEQRAADPLTARVKNAIHFGLPDGETIEDAFTYDWRLWSPVELADALREAGFKAVEFYDSYGDAIDDAGRVHPAPLSLTDSPEEPGIPGDETAVIYVAGRK